MTKSPENKGHYSPGSKRTSISIGVCIWFRNHSIINLKKRYTLTLQILVSSSSCSRREYLPKEPGTCFSQFTAQRSKKLTNQNSTLCRRNNFFVVIEIRFFQDVLDREGLQDHSRRRHMTRNSSSSETEVIKNCLVNLTIMNYQLIN